ncbi:MAG TPA: hypothetical protein VHC22_10035 [Pirellulales bacterium]|nr:hypothetical protein [Pirellulales bacterium]
MALRSVGELTVDEQSSLRALYAVAARIHPASPLTGGKNPMCFFQYGIPTFVLDGNLVHFVTFAGVVDPREADNLAAAPSQIRERVGRLRSNEASNLAV